MTEAKRCGVCDRALSMKARSKYCGAHIWTTNDCRQCGKAVTVRRSVYDKGEGRYCSNRCKALTQGGLTPAGNHAGPVPDAWLSFATVCNRLALTPGEVHTAWAAGALGPSHRDHDGRLLFEFSAVEQYRATLLVERARPIVPWPTKGAA